MLPARHGIAAPSAPAIPGADASAASTLRIVGDRAVSASVIWTVASHLRAGVREKAPADIGRLECVMTPQRTAASSSTSISLSESR